MDRFAAARLKVEWANKHINDLRALLVGFFKTDFYTISIDRDGQKGTNHLVIDFDAAKFPSDHAALTVGDVLHNLRSSLDLLYFQVVSNPSDWTRFPIFETRKQLETFVNCALEKQQLSVDIHELIFNTIKPHETGNPSLWALHSLNVRDKHQLLIPVLKVMGFNGICLEDDQGISFKKSYIADEPCRIRLWDHDDRFLTVKDKGEATGTIFFDIGIPFGAEAIIPTLKSISEEVARTIEAFELLLTD